MWNRPEQFAPGAGAGCLKLDGALRPLRTLRWNIGLRRTTFPPGWWPPNLRRGLPRHLLAMTFTLSSRPAEQLLVI